MLFLTHKLIQLRDVAQSGRASGLGPEGRMFESCHPDHWNTFFIAALNQFKFECF